MQDSTRNNTAASEQRAGLVDSIFYLAASIVGRGAQLLAVPFLVRMLSPTEFGQFDLALVSVTLVATALLMGTDSGVAPDYARCDPQDLPSIRNIFVASCQVPLVLGAGACALLGLAHLSGMGAAGFFRAAWLILLCALLSSLLSCLVGLLRWTTRVKRAATLAALMGVIPLAGALAVAFMMPRPSAVDMLAGLAMGFAVATVISAALSLEILRGLGASRATQGAIALLKKSWTLGAASLATPARRSAERLVILALLGESALAAYAVLARLSQVIEICLQALGNGLYPRALRLLDGADGKELAVRSLRLFWIASIAAVLAFAAGASPLVQWMGATAFTASPYLLPIVAVVACLSALPFCSGMGYFHQQRIALYALMLMSTGLVSLATATAGAWITQSLAGWCLGLLAGSAACSFAFVYVSEKLHPVGVRAATVAGGLSVLALAGVLPLLVAG